MREKNKLSTRNEELLETLNKTKDRIQVLEEENFILREEK
jgi:predicted nuclease with TOPRIM domain